MIVLIALIGGVAMASIEAGRRTQSSYPAFLDSTNPSDLSVSMYNAMTGAQVADQTSKIARLPGVRRVRTVIAPIIYRIGPTGAAEPNGLVQILGSADGEFSAQDRLSVVQGHRADPERADEVVMDASTARTAGVHVGDHIVMGLFSPAQTELPGFTTSGVPPRYRVDLHLVGIVDANNDLVQDDIDKAYGLVYMTPALVRKVSEIVPVEAEPEGYAIQLAGGAKGVPLAEREITELAPAGAQIQFHVTARVVANVELSLRPSALAIGCFGAIAALVCMMLGLQAVARQVRLLDEERQLLHSLGAGTVTAAGEAVIGVVGSILMGALLAGAVAVLLSPLAPLGPVRPVYPYRGIAFDWTVLGLGALLLVGGLGAAAFFLVWRNAPRRARRAGAAPARPSRVARAAQASGMPLASVIGLRFALEPGEGRTSLPVRSALFGAVVAVGLVVTTLVFASSLQTLVSHPALYGWDWSYALDPADDVPPAALQLLDRDPDVAAWSGVDYNELDIDGLSVPVIMSRPGETGPVAPPILSGHGLQGGHQIVMGSSTLRVLHKRVGDTILLSYGTPVDAPLYLAPTRLLIVGTATFPAVGFESLIADHTSMGTGAYFSEEVFPAAFAKAVNSPDPVLDGPGLVFVRMRPDLSPAASQSNLRRIADAAEKILAADPNASGYLAGGIQVLGVQRPAQIVDYRTIGRTPLLLAVGLAMGAVVALALTLLASARRRRQELALLKALGLTPRQVAAAVAWQATAAAAAGVAVGIPVGIASGRQLWILFARTLDAVPSPSVPTVSILIVAVVAFALANLVAAVPGRAAGRTSTAALLRAE